MSKKQKSAQDQTNNKINLQYTTLIDSIIRENTLPQQAIKKYKKNTWIYIISIFSIFALCVIVGIIIWQIIVNV
ncbi:hypothetical protein BCF59_0239 [Mycoplasmopsis mustelae]|uniref:Uncharacterized protein n=1 Tax=Mycoplasmopsis mustelae TaxID=171289 RepID=A0A4R7UF46_9BACT|nr:hypothetical protein [Mycoplasmopsis mustelae]TDV24284.1 hypothetical protein BCF59_0239 [Mycoplasmopsis mustelae]